MGLLNLRKLINLVNGVFGLLPITNGGTAADNATTARSNLGAVGFADSGTFTGTILFDNSVGFNSGYSVSAGSPTLTYNSGGSGTISMVFSEASSTVFTQSINNSTDVISWAAPTYGFTSDLASHTFRATSKYGIILRTGTSSATMVMQVLNTSGSNVTAGFDGAGNVYGSGSNLTALNASNISSGSLDAARLTDASIGLEKLSTIAARSVIGNSGNTVSGPVVMTGTTDQVLCVNPAGTALFFSSINLASSGAVGSSILAATNGGTAQSTYSTGDILYASAANTLSKLAGNTTATRKWLRQTGSGSASAAPAWDTLTSADMPAFTGGDVTSSAGSGTLTIGANKVTLSMLATVTGLSVLGQPASGSASPSAISTTTADSILRVNGAGTSLAFGSIDLSKTGAVGSSILSTGNLPMATQANMEAEASSVVVSPNIFKYHPGVVKAWAKITVNGSNVPTVTAGYNVSSVSRTGTGAYTVTFTNALSSGNCAGMCSAANVSGVGNLTPAVNSVGTTTMTMLFTLGSATPTDPTSSTFTVMVAGDFA